VSTRPPVPRTAPAARRTSKRQGIKQEISQEAFRRAILAAATQLFVTKGFDGTNMRDISSRLGVTRSAVYYYYANKQAILQALTEGMTITAKREIVAISSNDHLDPPEALRELVRRYAMLILEDPQRFRVVERNESSLPSKQEAEARDARRAVYDAFSAAIERGIASGHFRSLDARLTAFHIIGTCTWTAWWYQPGGRKTAKEIIEAIADLAVHAVIREGQHSERSGPEAMVRVIRAELDHLEDLLSRPTSS
jgi:AcrR family transcriptional regulator